MSITRPTLPELIARVETDLSGRLLDGETPLSRSVVSVLARVEGGLTDGMYGYLAWLQDQPFVDKAEAEYLERHSRIWGVLRKAAVKAAGSVSLPGTDGAILPAGTELQRVDGALYTTDAEATVAAGVAIVAVTAAETGTAGNTPAGVTLSLTSPVTAMESTATIGAAGLAGGLDEETDTALRARVLTRIQKSPQGGCLSDYRVWALEVPGVTRAWTYSSHMGVGTVGVAIVADDAAAGPIPTAELVASAQAHIDGKRPATAEVFVFAPAAMVVNVTLSVAPDTAAVRKAVKAELGDLFARESVPGGTILLSHMREAVSVATGETDNAITIPAADVVASGTAFPVLGAVAFA